MIESWARSTDERTFSHTTGPKVVMYRILLTLLIFMTCPVLPQTGWSNEPTPDRKVVYKTASGVDLKLHVFEPEGIKAHDKRPAIIFFFGGGWSGGKPKQFYTQSRELSALGMVAFCAEYRVKGRNKTSPFECVKDAKSAIRWVRQHSGELGVDPKRIVASGGSAGGHIAVCAGLIEGFEEGNEKLSVSSRPDLLVLFNPVLDTTARGLGMDRVGEDRQTEISPCHHVRAGLPPTLLFHGTKDKTVPFENATRFTKLMEEAGNHCKLVSFEGAGHGFFNSGFFRPKIKDLSVYKKCMNDCVAFLISHTYLPDGAVLPELESSGNTNDPERPNIIFLMTDDQRWDNFGCYGKPEFKTTNIDQLASQGVVFDNAYYAVAICMPSRVTMMTGRYFSSHRVGFSAPNNYTLSQSDFADSYPAQLRRAGYRTGFIGKFGFAVTAEAKRPNSPKGYRFEDHLKTTFDYFAGDGTHSGGDSKIWPTDDQVLQEIYREGTGGKGRTLKTGRSIIHFLDTQPKDQPFCLSVSFLSVKHDRDADLHRPHFNLFKEFEFSPPANWVNGANDKLPKVVAENWRGPPLHLKRSSTPKLYQRQVRRFAAQGYTVDQQVGLMMNKLRKSGLLDNTVIIYTSDNGRFQGSHGLFDKAILYDESVKAPLIVFDGRAGESNRGRREQALISSVDIAPTIMSLAGLENPKSVQGNSFHLVLNKTQDMSKWRKSVFMESLFLSSLYRARKKKNVDEINAEIIADNKSYRCRGLRTDRWKYFVYYEHNPPIEELYDFSTDSLEQINLAENPEFQDVLVGLRSQTEEMYSQVANQNAMSLDSR